MLGAIIGDIVGSRCEFHPTNDYNFEWLSEENGFTDDTICTVAVADALLHDRDFGESIHGVQMLTHLVPSLEVSLKQSGGFQKKSNRQFFYICLMK